MANPRPARPYMAQENTVTVDVESWTQGAIEAMSGLAPGSNASAPAVQAPVAATTVDLQIPLDENTRAANGEGVTAGDAVRQGYVLRRKSSQRDSMRRRDALLKGKEGTRQRRRWENDRLVGNPHAEPPLPADWAVGYTHPVHTVPYYLAPLWDARYAKKAAQREEKERASKSRGRKEKPSPGIASAGGPVGGSSDHVGAVPKDLKEKLKRSKGAKSLLQDLEVTVRVFLEDWEKGQYELELREEKQRQNRLAQRHAADMDDADSSESDEEIVFVGRGGQMHDQFDEPASPTFDSLPSSPFKGSPGKRTEGHHHRVISLSNSFGEELFPTTPELEREKLIHTSPASSPTASFGRWLVHSIGAYYGLDTWSITVPGSPGDPEAHRDAYVGIPSHVPKVVKTGRVASGEMEKAVLPRPLWAMV